MPDLLFENVRLLDPATGLDQIGALLLQNGRIADLGHGSLPAGGYRLVFDVAAYLDSQGRSSPFLQRVSIEFQINADDPHYHVPLLLTPYACTSYRGS